jgi:RIO-like serine/threonine protein kinase
MNVLTLIQKHNEEVPVILGEQIGQGADGQVFIIKNEPNKVIKLSVIYGESESDVKNAYRKVTRTLSSIRNENMGAFVRVDGYGFLGSYATATKYYALHYHMMERLFPISDDEEKVFHSLLSHEDANKMKNYSSNQIEEMLDGMKKGLDFDVSAVKFFVENLKNSHVVQLDLHPRNIMKDKAGQFKIIDCDRCHFTN